MQKILVPFDGSKHAMRALDYAVALAKKGDPTSIHVLTVMPEPTVYGEIEVYVTPGKMEALERGQGADILKQATTVLDRAGISYTSEVAVGDASTTICKRAEELGSDAIVMGTRGMGPVGNLVMGSVATKVVHLTKLPVTLVK